MAYRQGPAGLICLVHDLTAFFLGVAHGLFQQDMIAQLHGPERRLGMVVIQGADKGTVCHAGLGQKLLPGRKTVVRGDIQLLREQLTPVSPGLCQGDDLKLPGIFLRKAGVGAAPAARAQNDCCDRFHDLTSHTV